MNRADAMPEESPRDICLIGCGHAPDGDCAARDERVEQIGFKAFALLRMAQLGLSVPPAFVLGTGYCPSGNRQGSVTPSTWLPALRELERATGKRFGDPRAPLLVSVRSGAAASMPGMLGTLLNIGLCDATVRGFVRQTGNPRLVWDTYRRLVASYGELAAGMNPDVFEAERATLMGDGGPDTPSDFAQLRELTRRSLAAYEAATGQPFPQDPQAQLRGAIAAVHASWNSDKARTYRQRYGIGDEPGTAVSVQAMVFGNGGGRSGAGVGFSRDPCGGEPRLWIDFLFDAQGEDVVSGRRRAGHETLSAVLPDVWRTLRDACARLERAFGDMQDFEFTVQDGRLYLLQSRAGKRTAIAAARIALDLLDEGVIDAKLARERTASIELSQLVRTRVVSEAGAPSQPLAHAAVASVGVACGEIALDERTARARHALGVPVILVRRNADTGDLGALTHALGVLTQRGARTSHAAVVARQLGKVCLIGSGELQIDESRREIRLGDMTLREGATLTLDGNDGAVYAGASRTVTEPLAELQERLARFRTAYR